MMSVFVKITYLIIVWLISVLFFPYFPDVLSLRLRTRIDRWATAPSRHTSTELLASMRRACVGTAIVALQRRRFT